MRQRKERKEIWHRRKLFGGKMGAEEVASQYRKPCLMCNKPAVLRVKILMLVKDFTEQSPQMAAAIAATNPDGPFIPTIPTTFGPMVKVSDVTACRLHQKDLEREAAKAPSWVLVELDRGPGADNPSVQVLH